MLLPIRAPWPAHAAVTVTTGLLALMNREELEGVLAHEISHIKNYDTRLLLVVTTLIGMAGLIAGMIWRSAFLMRSRGRDGAQLILLVLAAGALLSVVGFVVGPVIRLALSRRRESLADASAVDLCRNPAGLLGALRKLQTNDVPLVRVNHATAAMCIDDPLQHHEGAMHRLFDTHPPIAERIAVLEHMQQGLTRVDNKANGQPRVLPDRTPRRRFNPAAGAYTARLSARIQGGVHVSTVRHDRRARPDHRNLLAR